MERDCKKRYKGDGEEEEGTAGWLRKKSRKGKSESHKIVDVFQTWGITGWGEGEGFWGGTTGFGEMDGCLKKKIKVEMMWNEEKIKYIHEEKWVKKNEKPWSSCRGGFLLGEVWWCLDASFLLHNPKESEKENGKS